MQLIHNSVAAFVIYQLVCVPLGGNQIIPGLAKKGVILDWEPECDFELISIVSSIRDYRICWLLNQSLGYKLEWKEEVSLTTEKGRQRALFTRFAFNDELNWLQFHFINNKYLGEYLVPEQKQVDYFLLIEGSHAQIEQQRALQVLRDSPLVQAAFVLDANSLRSKKNLIFE